MRLHGPAATTALLAVALLLAAAAAAHAQAPLITPAGRPSVHNDTSYRLAVAPARIAENDASFILIDRLTPAGDTD